MGAAYDSGQGGLVLKVQQSARWRLAVSNHLPLMDPRFKLARCAIPITAQPSRHSTAATIRSMGLRLHPNFYTLRGIVCHTPYTNKPLGQNAPQFFEGIVRDDEPRRFGIR